MTTALSLDQPFALPHGKPLKNRLVKSAMSETLGLDNGRPAPALSVLYQAWAQGGIGLNITGNVMIDPQARGEPGNVVVENERDLDALQAWAQAGTQNGSQIWMQLNHPGKQAPRGLNLENVAPSAVPFRPDLRTFFPTPRALQEHEIEHLIQRFGRSAKIAQRAGFSGVQIHGAHGYLVSQFLSPHHNRRGDRWGGTPDKRRRFVLEVLAEIRRQVGPNFPIGIKLNSADFQHGGLTEEESLDTLRALEAAGIDLIEISGGTYEAPVMTGTLDHAVNYKPSTRLREAYFLEFAELARSAIKTPLVVTGGFRTPDGMNAALNSGALDLIGLGRLLAIEPDAPLRLLQGLAPRHTVRPIRTGIGAIDRSGMLEITWYSRQIKRLSQGHPPQPNESPLKVFLLSGTKMMLGGRWQQRKLRAGH